jgi:3-hydroxyacyl-[acyl-carrier-protein] dehydratase
MASETDLIPHRPPWLLVDRVVSRAPDRVEAEKRVTVGDPLGALQGMLLVEALAQAAACANAGFLGGHRGYLVAAQNFQFEGRARPGDTVRLVAVRTGTFGALAKFDGEASVEGRVIARGSMTFALEKA